MSEKINRKQVAKNSHDLNDYLNRIALISKIQALNIETNKLYTQPSPKKKSLQDMAHESRDFSDFHERASEEG